MIVMKLRQVEVLNSQGIVIAQAAREIGATEQAYYREASLGATKTRPKPLQNLAFYKT